MRPTTSLAVAAPIAVPECGIFSLALNAAPRLEEVAGAGPWTLLVPTDEAFRRLSTEAVDELLQPSLPLTELLRTHLVRGVLAARDLEGAGWLLTVSGDYLPVDAFAGVVLIDGAQVLRSDLHMPYGIVHVIDRVLVRERSSSLTPIATREVCGAGPPNAIGRPELR